MTKKPLNSFFPLLANYRTSLFGKPLHFTGLHRTSLSGTGQVIDSNVSGKAYLENKKISTANVMTF